MRIEQLKYFLEVAKSGSINATAQRLFISQQGISDALKRMESEWGVILFNRSKTGISLTPEGERVYKYVAPIVKQYAELENYLCNLHNGEKIKSDETVRILTNPLSMTVLIPDLLDLLEKQQPFLDFFCTDATALEQMIRQIQEATVDLGIFMLMQSDAADILRDFPDDVQIFKLFEDELVACVAKDSELGRRKNLSASEFHHLDKVLCAGVYTSPQNYDVEFISNNINVQLKLILKKEMAAVTNYYFFSRTFPKDAITALPIRPPLKVTYYLLLPREELNQEIAIVLNVLEKYVLELTGQIVDYHDLI